MKQRLLSMRCTCQLRSEAGVCIESSKKEKKMNVVRLERSSKAGVCIAFSKVSISKRESEAGVCMRVRLACAARSQESPLYSGFVW